MTTLIMCFGEEPREVAVFAHPTWTVEQAEKWLTQHIHSAYDMEKEDIAEEDRRLADPDHWCEMGGTRDDHEVWINQHTPKLDRDGFTGSP